VHISLFSHGIAIYGVLHESTNRETELEATASTEETASRTRTFNFHTLGLDFCPWPTMDSTRMVARLVGLIFVHLFFLFFSRFNAFGMRETFMLVYVGCR
jgi:hypothetical protein